MREVEIKIDELKGKTFVAINIEKYGSYETKDLIKFTTKDNEWYIMKHEQDCCENVYIESIVGNIESLIGLPILIAEESSNRDNEIGEDGTTWTFYKFATAKGYVDIRWIGESNGYYSESVEFYKLKADY